MGYGQALCAQYRIELGSRSVNNFYWDFSLRVSSAEEKIAKKYFLKASNRRRFKALGIVELAGRAIVELANCRAGWSRKRNREIESRA